MSGEPLHELVFTDRAARPAKWQTRCGRTDVPLERTMTPTPTSHYQVTCGPCIRAEEREACAQLAESEANDYPYHDDLADAVRAAYQRAADLIRTRTGP